MTTNKSSTFEDLTKKQRIWLEAWLTAAQAGESPTVCEMRADVCVRAFFIRFPETKT